MTDLRERFSELDLIEAPAVYDEPPLLLRSIAAETPSHHRARPVWLVLARTAAATLLLVGGAIWLLNAALGESPEVAGTSTSISTTSPTTTVPADPDEGFLPVFPLGEPLPAFAGTFRLTGNRLEIQYAGPGSGLRVDLLEGGTAGHRGPFSELIEGGPGSYLVFDGVQQKTYLANDDIVEMSPPLLESGGISMMDWRSEGGPRPLCETTIHAHVGAEEIAGRQAHVIDCEGLGQAFTVWVDRDTGVILRMDNRTSPPLIDDFAFDEIRYEPEFDTGTFVIDPPAPTAISPEPEEGTPDWFPGQTRAWMAEMSNGVMWEMGVSRGDAAPPLTGTYLDGAPFDLDDLRGTPVLLHFWWAESSNPQAISSPERYYDHVLQNLAAEQWAVGRYGGDLEVVSIATGEIDVIERIIGLTPHPLRVVIPDGQTNDPDCDCAVVWDFPFPPGSTWVLIGADGSVVEGFYQYFPVDEAIEIVVDFLLNGRGGAGRWTLFGEEQGLASDCVTALDVAPNGWVWAGCSAGVSVYGGGNPLWDAPWGPSPFDSYRWTTVEGPAGGIIDLVVGSDSTVWVVACVNESCDTEVRRLAGGEWSTFSGDAFRVVFDLAAGPDGMIAAGPSSPLLLFDGEAWAELEGCEGTWIDFAADGVVWASGNETGLLRCGEQVTLHSRPPWMSEEESGGVPSMGTEQIWAAPDGAIWADLSRYADGRWEKADIDLPVVDLAFGPAGDVWAVWSRGEGAPGVGDPPAGSGVHHYSEGSWTEVALPDDLSDVQLTAVAVDQRGCVWIGTADAGIARYCPSNS